MIYTDKYSLYHHKPVKKGEPSSDNGFIYTSMAKNMGLRIYPILLEKVFFECINDRHELDRVPKKVPISRDEIIGMISLGLIIDKRFFSDDWRYHRRDLKVDLVDQIKAVVSLHGQHRNYVWKKPVLDAYPIVFRLPIHDIYYAKKMWGKPVSIGEYMAWNLYKIVTIFNNDHAELNLLWTQLKDLGDKLTLMFINKKKVFSTVFPSDHPFNNVEKWKEY